jgi:catechol 2,3-dioxygenase-like lactoylglutathione lyase family enzyme
MSAAVAAGTFLHHLQIESRDPARLAAFYGDAMQMERQQIDNDTWLCRGPDRPLLIKRGRDNALGFAAFAVRDAEALAALRRHMESAGATLLPSPSPLFDARAFAVRDPEGNVLVFGLGSGEVAVLPRGVLRGPIQHVTVNSTDMAAMEKFYVDVLGFALSDRVRDTTGRVTTFFIRGNHEHHTVGVFLKDKAGLDHHSYEAGEWVTIRDWADYLATMRIPIVWGPGRHGPGNNLFVFIKDPDQNMIEISAEIEVIRDRPVKEWAHEPYTLNSWGPAIMRV